MKIFIHGLGLGGKSIMRLLGLGRAATSSSAPPRHIRPDVVSVGSVGRTGLPYILLGSVAKHVLREVSCAVLVAKSESIRFELP